MPLTFDLPIEQLKTYRGKNPCPSDFDPFWDKSLAEMRSIDSQVELTPADFQASNVECFHLFFTGVGGARIHAKLLRPTNAPSPHPAILLFHGYTGDSGDWFDKLGYVAAGFTVAALDCRGQAGLSEDRGRCHRQYPPWAYHSWIGGCTSGFARKDALPTDISRYSPTRQDCDGNA